MADSYCMILTTTGTREEADGIADLLVSGKLAAGVQINEIASCYTWKGKVNKKSEYLLKIMTATHLYDEVESVVVENHSYEIPEVIQVPITRGLAPYLEWIRENTR
jgi:periplasmic divalent cation tolerance protein